MTQPKFLILSGDGINCERETARAVELAGGSAEIVHVNDLIDAPEKLKIADGLTIPGGFSFGDELGSGQILALKIRHKLGDAFFDMVRAQKPVIGICNGFQVLMKMGLLPYPEGDERVAALAANESGAFIDRWVGLDVNTDSVCKWTEGLNTLRLPIRHGEGRVVFSDDSVYETLKNNGQIPLTYTEDVNGSHGRIAGLTDPTGMVLGLMPHPEAFVHRGTDAAPQRDIAEKGDGILLFENIIRVMRGHEKTPSPAKVGEGEARVAGG
ncbi:MAG: phosphoribosylformylglycinamidine synthase subunit PurQ [Alphaproteobacteria bacterium]|nr:phosphoribosylformylglycinamidine synthase subunit PurQ [Alphaproteobacteria bacterium]